ncbi:hypothetical protein T439DRAFT_343975, partial [Meredithblackwellia eburnea MCA 4105]
MRAQRPSAQIGELLLRSRPWSITNTDGREREEGAKLPSGRICLGNPSSTGFRESTRMVQRNGETDDLSNCNQATQDYLPYLFALLSCIESDDLLLKSEPYFTWKSGLSSHIIKKSRPKVTLPSLHYELSTTLYLYSLLLSNRSTTLVSTLGLYETSRSLSTAEQKAHDETINQAAEMLCRAAGVLGYLGETVLPRWENAVGSEGMGKRGAGGPGKGRKGLVELERETVEAVSKLFLAHANLLAIRRLLSRSLSLTLLSPGPPLPKTHPSPSLLSKLHLHTYALLDSSRSLLKPPQINDDIASDFKKFINNERGLVMSLSFKWLGVDCGENGGRDKAGECLCWLGMAKGGLEDLGAKGPKAGLKGFVGKVGKGGKDKDGIGKVEREYESVKGFERAYKKVNDTVHFQPLPTPQSLLLLLPSGVAALQAKPFSPPPLAFSPRNTMPRPPKATTTKIPIAEMEGMSLVPGAGGAGGGPEESDDESDE